MTYLLNITTTDHSTYVINISQKCKTADPYNYFEGSLPVGMTIKFTSWWYRDQKIQDWILITHVGIAMYTTATHSF